MLKIESFPVGMLQANCHIAYDDESKEGVIVDPGGDPGLIEKAIADAGITVAAIWNTHGHIDHIGANAAMKRLTGAPISIHPLEEDWLTDGDKNLASWIPLPFEPQPADALWNEGDEFEALGRSWRIIHVPGHSPGSVAIICDAEKLLFGGDVLMRGAIGRCDLPGGDPAVLAESLKRLMELPDDYRVYSGHSPVTTIGEERHGNLLVMDILAGRGL
ncbi:MBL fold metallo-hydrolase [bacterium]|nr:MBL fold metallo-hydrolase [bacterium]